MRYGLFPYAPSDAQLATTAPAPDAAPILSNPWLWGAGAVLVLGFFLWPKRSSK